MPAFPRNPPSLKKPWPSQGVDWTHPLARGLIGAWLFREGGSTSSRDAARTQAMNLAAAGTLTWDWCKLGRCVVTNGSSMGQATMSPTFSTGSAFTAVYWFAAGAYGGTTQEFSMTDSGGSTGIQIGGSGSSLIVRRQSDGGTTITGPSRAAGDLNQIALRFDGGSSSELFINGGSVATGGAPQSVTCDTISLLRNANASFPEAVLSGGYIPLAQVYNRYLSAAEILQLCVSPFCFMQPLGRWGVTGSTATPGGTAFPYHYYQQMRA